MIILAYQDRQVFPSFQRLFMVFVDFAIFSNKFMPFKLYQCQNLANKTHDVLNLSSTISIAITLYCALWQIILGVKTSKARHLASIHSKISSQHQDTLIENHKM